MDVISKVEINNFRSIYRLEVEGLSHVNIFSGLNDVGKSNVIKALNLFFNNQVDWQTDLEFERDTNTFHARKPRNWKTRKLISVKLTFERPRNRYRSLSKTFWVKRQWDRDYLTQPKETFGDASGAINDSRMKSSITKFLKRCKFFYVPAIRGQTYFQYLVQNLAATLADQPSADLEEASSQVEYAISNRSAVLIAELQAITNLDFELQLPSSMRALLEAATFHTQGNVPLHLRGDGIQSMTVPVVLSYLSKESKGDFYYWALEEPENSLEYIKSTELADQIHGIYSHDAQIFLSSHSPAFLAMHNDRTSIYRVFKGQERYESTRHEEAVTKIQTVSVRGSEYDETLLPEELGFYKIARDYDLEMRKVVQDRDDEIARLSSENRLLTTPTLLVEGVNDKAILEEAWRRLYNREMPFKIDDVGGANKLKERSLAWVQINSNRMCALFDYDDAGIKAVNGVKSNRQFYVKDNSRSLYKEYLINDRIMAFTLPVPSFYNRRLHAENLNLQTEWYFSDSRLKEIDDSAQEGLFDRTSYVKVEGNSFRTLKVGQDGLCSLIGDMVVRFEHRILTTSGKTALVDSLGAFSDVDFLNFYAVFRTVLTHLFPDNDLDLTETLQDTMPM